MEMLKLCELLVLILLAIALSALLYFLECRNVDPLLQRRCTSDAEIFFFIACSFFLVQWLLVIKEEREMTLLEFIQYGYTTFCSSLRRIFHYILRRNGHNEAISLIDNPVTATTIEIDTNKDLREAPCPDTLNNDFGPQLETIPEVQEEEAQSAETNLKCIV